MCELCLYKYKSLAFNPFFFPTEDVCPIPMDTTFIIDSSFCDGNDNWNRLLKFVQTLVTFYDVSPSGGRIALIPFGTNANVVLKFSTLTGSLLNGAEVNRRVSLLQCQRGFRRIDKALDLAFKEVLTSAGGMRDVSRVKYLPVYTPSTARHLRLRKVGKGTSMCLSPLIIAFKATIFCSAKCVIDLCG